MSPFIFQQNHWHAWAPLAGYVDENQCGSKIKIREKQEYASGLFFLYTLSVVSGARLPSLGICLFPRYRVVLAL
jgi:hypothetical protein